MNKTSLEELFSQCDTPTSQPGALEVWRQARLRRDENSAAQARVRRMLDGMGLEYTRHDKQPRFRASLG